MTEEQAHKLFTGVFTTRERRFLFSHPEFAKALAQATENDFRELGQLGQQVLLDGNYNPSAVIIPDDVLQRKQPRSNN